MKCTLKVLKKATPLVFALILLLVPAVMAGDEPYVDYCVDIEKTGPYFARPGDTITYRITLLNCGCVGLWNGLGVFDPMLADNPDGLLWSGILNAGMSIEPIEVQYTVTESDCGLLVNTAWAHSPYDGVYDESTWVVEVECDQPGAGTPGYWKNHPEAWPVDVVTIGGMTYTQDEALDWLWSSVAGDKTITLFKALVATKLNIMIGNPADCISGTVADADEWMAAYPVGSGVEASSFAWEEGEPLYETLDEYNNGMLCAMPRD